MNEDEKWLFENREALESVLRGLDDVSKGKVSPCDIEDTDGR